MCWLESYCRQDVANVLGQLLTVGHTTSVIGMNYIDNTACEREKSARRLFKKT